MAHASHLDQLYIGLKIGPLLDDDIDIGMVAILVWVTSLSVLLRYTRLQLKWDSNLVPLWWYLQLYH